MRFQLVPESTALDEILAAARIINNS